MANKDRFDSYSPVASLLDLHSDTANYRLVKRGEATRVKSFFNKLEALKEQPKSPKSQVQRRQSTKRKSESEQVPTSHNERLKRLSEGKQTPQATLT